jgi:hypothetical protein
MWIWFECDWWKWFTPIKTCWSKNFDIPWNQDWLKWWFWKCFRFNSRQVWIWFKWNWWKWFTIWKTFRSKNFNIPWNQDWLKWWTIKCFRFNSCQLWIWFKYNELKLPMPFQNYNRVRNPDLENLSIRQCTECHRIDWAIYHNNSTFIEFGRVRITNSLWRFERLQHESEVTRNRYEESGYWGKVGSRITTSNVRCSWQNWGESLTLWMKGGMETPTFEIGQWYNRSSCLLNDLFNRFSTGGAKFRCLRRRYHWERPWHFLTKSCERG